MASDNFPTSTAGLAPSVETPVVELSDGDELDLTIAPVTKEIDGDTLRMLAYNGSIPGPTLKVRQNSEIAVHVRNEGDLEATVHWHGLRLDMGGNEPPSGAAPDTVPTTPAPVAS